MQKLLRPEITATSYIHMDLFVDSSRLNLVSFYLLVQQSEFNTPSPPTPTTKSRYQQCNNDLNIKHN